MADEADELAKLVRYPHGPLVDCRQTGAVVNFPCATDCDPACSPEFERLIGEASDG